MNDFLENLQARDYERSWLGAAEKGDIQKLQTLLDNRKFNINARDEMGYTALHLAVMYENLDILQFLLDQPMSSGLNVYQADAHGRNLLHLAAQGQNREIETYLQGLNIFDMDSKGQYHLSPREIAQQRQPQVGPEGEGVGRSSFFSEEKTSANGAQLVR